MENKHGNFNEVLTVQQHYQCHNHDELGQRPSQPPGNPTHTRYEPSTERIPGVRPPSTSATSSKSIIFPNSLAESDTPFRWLSNFLHLAMASRCPDRTSRLTFMRTPYGRFHMNSSTTLSDLLDRLLSPPAFTLP